MFIDSSDPGGAESLVVELAVALRSDNVDVEIWHLGNAWLEAAAGAEKIPLLKLSERFYRKSYLLPFFAIYLTLVIRRRRVDVLHSHLYGAIVASALPALFAGARHVGTLHDVYTIAESRWRIVGLRVAHFLRTEIVTVAQVIESLIRTGSRGKWQRLKTIHNGVVVAAGGDKADKKPILDNNPHAVCFICVARLIELKNIDVLIRAASELADEHVFNVVIVGDGPQRGVLESLVAELELSDKIHFFGFRNDVDRLLESSDCFVLPSSSEGLSCSIMEAMAAGLPVIACEVGGNAELVVHEETGLLVAPDDAVALAHAMLRVLESASWRSAAGSKALERTARHFSLERMVQRYLQTYSL